MSCSVCCQPFTIAVRRRVECQYCDYDCCRVCAQQYLLSSEQDAHCMNCRNGWNREVLDRNFTKSFLTGPFKKHRESLLFEREKALLPASQTVLGNFRLARQLRSDLTEAADAIAEHRREIERLYRDTHEKRMRLATLERTNYADNGDGETTERRAFVKPCPAQDCRGFLSTQYRCGTCGIWCCPQCHEIKGHERDIPHECDPAAVETARTIARETKPCPGCGASIYKISGCDQMWCVQCHVAFSWRTGQRVQGVIHNPHWYEWQRRNNNGEAPRVPGDIPCGGVPSYHAVHRVASRLTENSSISRGDYSFLMRLHRLANHAQHAEIPRLANRFDAADNADLRLLYLLNEIDDATFKAKLQQREKKREKQIAVREILETFVAAASDLMREFVDDTKDSIDGPTCFHRCVHQLTELVQFSNDALRTVGNRFGMRVQFLGI